MFDTKQQSGFLQAEIDACTIYLDIAKTSEVREHREQALANAAYAYAAVKGHFSDVALNEKDTNSLENWIEQVGKELRDLLAP